MNHTDRGAKPAQRLAHLIGEWEGSGWFRVGDHEVRAFHQTETVRAHLDGALLTIEGHGVDEADGHDTHRAFAVLSFDQDADRFHWDAHIPGSRTSTELILDAAGFSWTMTTSQPATITVYRIEVDHTTWHETGTTIQDGNTWTQVLEMTLHRHVPGPT